MANEDIITALMRERAGLQDRIGQLTMAIEALGGNGDTRRRFASTRAPHVGDDKLTMVRTFIKQHTRKPGDDVRQADIVDGTGLNSGTVSQALVALEEAGEVEPGPKRNRSKTWVRAAIA